MKQILCLGACLVLVACGDPLANVDRLDDVELAQTSADAPAPTTAQVSARPEELTRRPGLLGLLRGDSKPDTAATAVDDAVADVAAPDSTAPVDQPAPSAPAETRQTAPATARTAAATVAAADAKSPAQRRGFLGRLLRGGPDSSASPGAATAAAAPAPAAVQQPVLAAAPQPAAPAAAPKADSADGPRRGLFSGRARTPRIDPNAPDAQVVSYGVAVPFGRIVRVCDVPRGSYGKEIGRYPERRPEYRLYDSKPSQTGPRTHYITGFKDGCARQFTAALALFGEPGLHEQLRYGLPSKVQPYSRTDEAYEKVKSRVCRVPKGKSCGARIDKLAKDTVFVSTYERFVGSASWANILLHAGEVVEKDQLQR